MIDVLEEQSKRDTVMGTPSLAKNLFSSLRIKEMQDFCDTVNLQPKILWRNVFIGTCSSLHVL